jgi:membrane-bound serine protease (ClpP class)
MDMKRLVRLIGVIGLAGLLAAFLLPSPAAWAAQDGAPEVVVLEATGPIAPALAEYIRRGLAEADSRNAEAVVLMLDTPGGSVTVTSGIVQDIQASDVPVIVFVGPRGAIAGSAGLIVTLAGHAAAMAPGTAIGASSPVGAGGQDLPDTMFQKEVEFLSAQARSLAERRGDEAVQIAEQAVTDARAVSASEALTANLVDFGAEDVGDLLAQADGFTVEVNGRERTLNTTDAVQIPLPMSPLERILLLLTDPNIIFLLLTIGPVAIVFEVRSPGGGLAGVFGTLCLGVALYGLGVMPVNWLGIIFVVTAFPLFILEIKAPVHGALAATGVVSLAVGAIILFNQPGIAPFGELSIPLVIVWSLLMGGLFVFLMAMALRAQRRRPTTGYQGLIGQIGRVTQTLDPTGMVQVFGERWQAQSVGGVFIPVGAQVEVIEAGHMRLIVRPVGDRPVSGGEPGAVPG